MVNRILRGPSVFQATGVCRSTLYNWMREQLWTKPVSLGPRSIGWPESEVAALNQARIAGKSKAEIQALVQRLEAARKGASV